MQTKEGVQARGIVASEIAAMFEFCVLPTLRRHCNPDNEADFEKQCRQFAKRIGLPRDEWPRVHYPFFLSLDWDPRHAHMRKLLTTPRLSAEVQQQMLEQSAPMFLDGATLPGPPPVRGSSQQHDLATQRYESALSDYYHQHGADFRLHLLWRSGLVRPWHRTLLPLQWAPLVKGTPDINQAAEHLVNSVKCSVRDQLLSYDMHSPELWKGRTYQQFVRHAVASAAGVFEGGGCHHAMRSVEKLSCTLRILAADPGEPVLVRYQFRLGGADTHEVTGTGGKWIRDTRWT